MASIGGGGTFIPKGLGQIQGATTAQEANEVQQSKGTESKGVDNTRDSYSTVEGGQTNDVGLSETLGPPGTGNRGEAGSLEGKARFLEEVSDAALMFSALMEMARQSQREMSDARAFKDAMHAGKIQAKKDGIEALKAQQEAERNSAALQLGASAATTGVALVAGGLGANAAVVQPLTQLGSQTASFVDKQWGFQRQADEKKVEIKQHERQEAIFDDSIDSAKNTYEEAKEQFKAALRIITEHAEREANNTSRFTS